MKDLVLYETVPTKFVSSFLELYFIFYEFSNFRNVSANMTAGTLASLPQVGCCTKRLTAVSSHGWTGPRNDARGRGRCGEHSEQGLDRRCSPEQWRQEAVLWDTVSSGAQQRRPPSVLVLRMGREHRAVREREVVWEEESDGSCSPASFGSWTGSEL
jgi:hypothetical protein